MTEAVHPSPSEPRPRALGRAWADLPLRAKGLVVVAIPVLALLGTVALLGLALAEDRPARTAISMLLGLVDTIAAEKGR